MNLYHVHVFGEQHRLLTKWYVCCKNQFNRTLLTHGISIRFLLLLGENYAFLRSVPQC